MTVFQHHQFTIVASESEFDMRAWQHIRATLLLPVMATIVIPATLLSVFGWDSIGVWGIHPAIRPTLSIIGAVLSLAGFGRYDIPLSEEPGLVNDSATGTRSIAGLCPDKYRG